MHLVEILLPLRHGDGTPISAERAVPAEADHHRPVRRVNSILAAPAEGVWKDDSKSEVAHDEIAVVEVMVEEIDAQWWRDLRNGLEARLGQKEIVIRSHSITRL